MSANASTSPHVTSAVAVRPRARRWWQKPEMVTLAVAAVLLVAGLVVEWTIHSEPVALALFWGAILIGGVYPLRSAIRAVRHKRLTITVLLVVAAIAPPPSRCAARASAATARRNPRLFSWL